MSQQQATWALSQAIDAVVFDCDGTLSHIEGIDELADANGVGHQVAQMTAVAMEKTGLSPELYQQRLNLVKPGRQQVIDLAGKYLAQQTEDAKAVISMLQQLGKSVYIISAGVNPSVQLFGEALGVPGANIVAVDLQFDAQGQYVDFDWDSPLVRKGGKRQVIKQIQQHCPRLVYIGDGLNDIEASDLVTRFVGYGGTFYRENIAAQSDFYLREPSVAALLPLSLTQAEYQPLISAKNIVWQRGLAQLNQEDVDVIR